MAVLLGRGKPSVADKVAGGFFIFIVLPCWDYLVL